MKRAGSVTVKLLMQGNVYFLLFCQVKENINTKDAIKNEFIMLSYKNICTSINY